MVIVSLLALQVETSHLKSPETKDELRLSDYIQYTVLIEQSASYNCFFASLIFYTKEIFNFVAFFIERNSKICKWFPIIYEPKFNQ